MQTIEGRPATPPVYDLAEGPVWNQRTELLYWVDIPRGAVIQGRITGEAIAEATRTQFSETVGAVAPAEDGGMIVAASHGLATIDRRGNIHSGPPVLAAGGHSRLNDGACDAAGRFVFGSLPTGAQTGMDVLLSADAAGDVALLRGDVGLSNGIAWSPDGRALYHVDTNAHLVWTAEYDSHSGTARNWTQLFVVDDGLPDGLTVDSEGLLWLAVWGTGEVRRYDTHGTVRAVVSVPAPHVSAPAFAGPDRDILVITTARSGLSPAERERAPLSGALFMARPGPAGLPEHRWGGSTAAPNWNLVAAPFRTAAPHPTRGIRS